MTMGRNMIALLAIGTMLLTLMFAGCGGSGGSDTTTGASFTASNGGTTQPVQLASVAPPSSPLQAQSATVGTAAVPSLVISLSTSLNGTGTVKATTITKAELFNRARTLVGTATITNGVASFPVGALVKGFYFVRINGLAKDLVPTKIDTITANTRQYVGTTLRNSVIGPLTTPKYKFTTYSLGQTQHPVVGYLSGVAGTPINYGYAMLYMGAGKLETRILGNAALLATVGLGGPHSNATWVLGPTNHGKSINGSCNGCHGSPTSKPMTYAGCTAGNGWCYKCHYGNTGVAAGLVNPNK